MQRLWCGWTADSQAIQCSWQRVLLLGGSLPWGFRGGHGKEQRLWPGPEPGVGQDWGAAGVPGASHCSSFPNNKIIFTSVMIIHTSFCLQLKCKWHWGRITLLQTLCSKPNTQKLSLVWKGHNLGTREPSTDNKMKKTDKAKENARLKTDQKKTTRK